MLEEEHIEQHAKERKSLLSRIGKVIRRVLLFLLLFLLVLSIAAVVLTQTKGFRQWLGGQILTIVNGELEGRIEFSDMGGDLLTGLTFDDIRLITRGDTLLYAKRLSVRYDLAPLLDQIIVVNGIHLESPVIRLVRGGPDSTWNFEHIAKPSTDTTASAPFNWTINLRNLTISNGTFSMKDSTAPPQQATAFAQLNTSDMHVDSLQLSITALAKFKAKDFALTINHIAYKDHNSSFALRNLSGKIKIDTTHTEVFDLHVLTGHTNLVLNAQLEDIALLDNFDPSSWDKIPADVNLAADSVSADDLRYFLPALDFLDGSVALSLDAQGTYGDLTINRMELALSNSTLSMTGKLRNLDTPEKLFIDAQLDRTQVSYADVRTHLPGLEIPNLSYLGQVIIDEATFRGQPTNFQSKFKVRTAIGNAQGTGTLNVGANPMRYMAHLETEKLNLAPALGTPDLQSSLNAIVDIEGVGTTLSDLNTQVRMQASNSEVAGRSFKDLYLVASARNRGLITADTLRIQWSTSPGMPQDGASSFEGRGWANLRNPSIPVYRFDAFLNHVNFANVMNDPAFATALTGRLQVSGQGFHPDSVQGTVTANFDRIATPDQSLDSLEFTATLLREAGNYRNFQLHSQIADISLRGNYRFTTLADALSRQVDIIIGSIQRRYRDITLTRADSVLTISAQPRTDTVAVPLENLNVDYYIRVRDLAPLSMLNEQATIHGDILLQGSIEGTTQDFLFTLDSSQITSLFYRDSSMSVAATPIELAARIRTPAQGDMGGLDARVYINSDSTIIFNDNILTGTMLDVEYKNEQVIFRAQSDINSTIDFYTVGGGDFDITGPSYGISLDSLTVGYMGSLQWRNEGPIRASFTEGSLNIDSLKMMRNEAEHISVSGSYGKNRFNNIEVGIEALPISDINRFLPSDDDRIESMSLLDGQLTRLGVTLNGTMEKPEIELYARLDSLTYNSFPIGNQTIDLTYSNTLLQGSTIVVNPLLKQDSTTLTLNINALPIDLAFASVDERIVSGNPIDIEMKAKRLSLGLVAPFVPAINKLQGFANTDFKIEGTTPDNITYSGDASFFNTSFTIASTNVRYAADGVVHIEKDLVKIKEVNLYNESLDLNNGHAKIYGELSFEGLGLTYIDLFITTPGLLVMNQASKASSPTLYGDMVIASEQDPLHFYGTLDKPYLRGSVNIKRADLVFPEDRSVALSAQNFCYKMLRKENGEVVVTVIDCVSDPSQTTSATTMGSKATSTTATVSTATVQQEAPRQNSDSTDKSSSRLSRMAEDVVRSAILRPNQSLMDILDIDLQIDIVGRFFLTMELGTLQSLNTEVTLLDPTEPLRYTQYGSSRRLYGSLKVKDGSTLTFYRTFKASGVISFPAGRIDNPQLDVIAEYESRRLKEQQFEPYKVKIAVTGTKEKPDFAMSYFINGNEAGGDPAQIQADAIMLIVLGRTQSELLASGGSSNLISSLSQDAVTASASAFLSNIFSGSGGIIRTAEIDLQGNEANNQTVDFSRSRLRFSGELSSFLQYRIESDAEMANTNFTLDIPLGAYFDNDILRNLALEITRAANSVNTITTQQREWELKLGWRWSF